jgi:hypothetical protein
MLKHLVRRRHNCPAEGALVFTGGAYEMLSLSGWRKTAVSTSCRYPSRFAHVSVGKDQVSFSTGVHFNNCLPNSFTVATSVIIGNSQR